MSEETANSAKTEKPWLFKKGQSGNPSGRPKNTLKDYLKQKFSAMTDEEKEQWLIDHKVPAELQWRMSEGNPRQDTDITSDGKPIVLPSEIIKQNGPDTGTEDHSQ